MISPIIKHLNRIPMERHSVWDELNAQPLKSPPAWVTAPSGIDPLKPTYRITEGARRLRGEPACSICGNRSAWNCDCEIGEEG